LFSTFDYLKNLCLFLRRDNLKSAELLFTIKSLLNIEINLFPLILLFFTSDSLFIISFIDYISLCFTCAYIWYYNKLTLGCASLWKLICKKDCSSLLRFEWFLYIRISSLFILILLGCDAYIFYTHIYILFIFIYRSFGALGFDFRYIHFYMKPYYPKTPKILKIIIQTL